VSIVAPVERNEMREAPDFGAPVGAGLKLAPTKTAPQSGPQGRDDRMIERKKGTFARLRLAASWHQINGPLFRKYVALFLAVVFVVLLINVVFEVAFSYQEQKDSLIRIQREQAEAASAKISQFIREIESQVGWTTQLPWSAGTLDQRRFDGLRLLRQVPAITELA